MRLVSTQQGISKEIYMKGMLLVGALSKFDALVLKWKMSLLPLKVAAQQLRL